MRDAGIDRCLGGVACAYLELRAQAVVAAHLRRHRLASGRLADRALRVPVRYGQSRHLPAAHPHQAQEKHRQRAVEHG